MGKTSSVSIISIVTSPIDNRYHMRSGLEVVTSSSYWEPTGKLVSPNCIPEALATEAPCCNDHSDLTTL